MIIYHIDTNNWGLKIPVLYQAEFFERISLPQNPIQETFWESAEVESTEKSVTLSDVSRWLANNQTTAKIEKKEIVYSFA